jgi:hypothetical protein
MRQAIIFLTLMTVSCAPAQAQTRAQSQEKLVQFLTTDLRLTPDQTSTVRGFVKQADNEMARYETQYFGKPEMLAKLRKQVTMDLGKRVETILTPSQLAQYPKTKQKLYQTLQKRYETEMNQVQGSEAQSREMKPAETREPK